jgi:hypothetical protein
MILCCVVCALILSILSTFPALCVCARSHAVTVFSNTCVVLPVNESAVHGDEEGDLTLLHILYLTVVCVMTL